MTTHVDRLSDGEEVIITVTDPPSHNDLDPRRRYLGAQPGEAAGTRLADTPDGPAGKDSAKHVGKTSVP